jgi:hypothetical protein
MRKGVELNQERDMIGMPEDTYPLINTPNWNPRDWSLERTLSETVSGAANSGHIMVTTGAGHAQAVYTSAASVSPG